MVMSVTETMAEIKIRPMLLKGRMSPYPTVENVTTVKYRAS